MSVYLLGFRRFVKGFLAGGIAAVLVSINSGVSFNSLVQLRGLFIVLATAFVTGGLLAVEKMMGYVPPSAYHE